MASRHGLNRALDAWVFWIELSDSVSVCLSPFQSWTHHKAGPIDTNSTGASCSEYRREITGKSGEIDGKVGTVQEQQNPLLELVSLTFQ